MPVAALTCLNIVLGNVSLRFVPVSFMQTIKCFTPATTSETASRFLDSFLLLCYFFARVKRQFSIVNSWLQQLAYSYGRLY
jgi:hypothetical protein